MKTIRKGPVFQKLMDIKYDVLDVLDRYAVTRRMMKVKKATVYKTLFGLFALGVCVKSFPSCNRALNEWAAEKARVDALPATLIDKNINYGHPGRVDYMLDLDHNPKTVEALARINSAQATDLMTAHDMTNGTTMTIEQWRELCHQSFAIEFSDKFKNAR